MRTKNLLLGLKYVDLLKQFRLNVGSQSVSSEVYFRLPIICARPQSAERVLRVMLHVLALAMIECISWK